MLHSCVRVRTCVLWVQVGADECTRDRGTLQFAPPTPMQVLRSRYCTFKRALVFHVLTHTYVLTTSKAAILERVFKISQTHCLEVILTPERVSADGYHRFKSFSTRSILLTSEVGGRGRGGGCYAKLERGTLLVLQPTKNAVNIYRYIVAEGLNILHWYSPAGSRSLSRGNRSK